MKNTDQYPKFYELSANGNTFILVSEQTNSSLFLKKEILQIADGLIVLSPSITASSHYIIYNKDLSRAKICGNGLLASTFYFHKIMGKKEEEYLFLTDSGYFKTKVNEDSYSVFYPLPKILSHNNNIALIDAFNLHQIKEVEKIDPDKMILEQEVLQMPINLHQFKKDNEETYSYISLENGVGFTASCLSGAASIYAYLHRFKDINTPITLKAPGGNIKISLKDFNLLEITGNVKCLFKGYLYEQN